MTGIQREHQVVIPDYDNQTREIQYEKWNLQVEIHAKDQQIAGLQRCHAGYIWIEGKNNGITVMKNNAEIEHP